MEFSSMMKKWLKCAERKDSPYSFPVVDVCESGRKPKNIADVLAHLIWEAYFDRHILAKAAEKYGWGNVSDKLIKPAIPTLKTVKRGDFGEVVANGVLRSFHSYLIPVEKLRSKMSGNQTLPGIDVLALRISPEEKIDEVCFVESKVRTVSDTNVGLEGYKQIKKDYEDNNSVILRFVATALAAREDPIADAFLDYLFSREDTRSIEMFRLFLFSDESLWSEITLQNMHENGVELPYFVTHAVKIRDLRELTESVFNALEAEEVEDD